MYTLVSMFSGTVESICCMSGVSRYDEYDFSGLCMCRQGCRTDLWDGGTYGADPVIPM